MPVVDRYGGHKRVFVIIQPQMHYCDRNEIIQSYIVIFIDK